MSGNRTKPTESTPKRDVLRDPQQRSGRVMLEYIDHLGGHLKWVNTFYGGEMRAG